MGVLSILTLLPLVGALLLSLLPKDDPKLARMVGIGFALATLAVAGVGVLAKFKSNTFHFQMVEAYQWVPQLGISFKLGVDGISLWLVMLTALMTVIAVFYGANVTHRTKTFMAMILVLETAMIGSFLSLDLILFFTFFELTLLPMYFLVTIWGGEKRNYAGTKFFIYTFAGSVFMLIGIIALGSKVAGGSSFDLIKIQHEVATGSLWAGTPVAVQALIFWSFAIALLVKAPSFPLHTWMPDTYAEAPVVAPVLSSVMVKLGTFGLLRFCLPLFPDIAASQTPILMILGVTSILYGAIVATVQPDARRLLAYSSLSHVGFILIGIFSLNHSGLMGASIQQINHGISASAMMILIGFLLTRRQSTELSKFGGLKRQMPIFATLFLLAMLSSIGLPGTNGFVGEFLALKGTFEAGYSQANGLSVGYAAVAGLGVVVGAGYLLYLFQQIFYGKVEQAENQNLKDLTLSEAGLVGVLLVFVLWGGLAPNTFLKPMEASIQAARLMSVNQAEKRPDWSNNAQEIDMEGRQPDRGALVLTTRTNEPVGDEIRVVSVIAPANIVPATPKREKSDVVAEAR